MNFIITAIAIFIFFYLLADVIKKYAPIFYIIALVSIIPIIMYYEMGAVYNMPRWFNTFVMDPFHRGMVSTIIFFYVMFLGCATKTNWIFKRWMMIRAEMSIIASIFALMHNIGFGIKYFVQFFTKPHFMSIHSFIASILSMILIILMLILMITSFKSIRKKMNPITWKKVQLLSYPFYYFMYLHIMVLFMASPSKFVVPIIIYSVIYALYTIFRIRKFVIKNN